MKWKYVMFFTFLQQVNEKWTPVIKVKIFVNTYDLMFHSFALINVFNIYLNTVYGLKYLTISYPFKE